MIYLLVGVPASGKSWVAEQLSNKFHYIPHDDYIGLHHTERYLKMIKATAKRAKRDILIETPFSMSKLMDPLKAAGLKVEPVFIIEPADTLISRYKAREEGEYSRSHLVRQETYKSRVEANRAFSGTSEEVLNYLKGKER